MLTPPVALLFAAVVTGALGTSYATTVQIRGSEKVGIFMPTGTIIGICICVVLLIATLTAHY